MSKKNIITICLLMIFSMFFISPAQAVTAMVAGGSNHSIGLKDDGTVLCAGSNEYGQCNVNTWSDIVQISTGVMTSIGLKSDGTVVSTGYNADGQCNTSGWTDIVKISSAHYSTIGVKSDGTIVVAGRTNILNTSWTDIVEFAGGYTVGIGLKSNGTVVGSASSWTNITQVSAGRDHVVGLKSDGTVVASGVNRSGQCDVGTWTDIVYISAGHNHTMGMKSDGTIVSTACLYPDWNQGQCGIDENWVDIIQPHGSTGVSSLGLKSDGTVIGIGENRDGMLNVQDWDLIGNSATLVLEPDNAAPVIGDTLCIDVNVQDVSGLYAAAFDLIYDPAVLSYESASEGNLLNADSGATFFNASLLNNDPANGTLVTGVSRVADIGTVSGSGTIATACFAVMGGSGSDTGVSLDNAYFEGADQGSVVDLTPGENPTIPVEIGIPQNLVVSDSGTLGQLNLSWDAAPDASGYEIYRADTSGGEFTLLGTSTGTGYEDANCILTSVSYVYKLKAISASGTTTGEYSDEASGTAAGLAGDINRDNRVDGRDLSILARAFNTTESDADYQCLANLDRTGTIDGDDLVILTASFGSQL